VTSAVWIIRISDLFRISIFGFRILISGTALDRPAALGYKPRPMKPVILFLGVLALGAGVGWCISAQEVPVRTTGKVLILQNERVFEGDIEKVGELYRVRKGPGEVVVPVNQ